MQAKKRKLNIESMLSVAQALEPSPQKTKLMDMVLELTMANHESKPSEDNANTADQALDS